MTRSWSARPAYSARAWPNWRRGSAREIHRVDAEWGRIVEPERIEQALKAAKAPKLVAIVHAETSTGIHQPIEEISKMAHAHGALMVADGVTSLGCVPLEIDAWQIDACYSCTQKGIGAPPGLSPVTFSPRAMEVVRKRKTPCSSWYFDLSLIEKYWGPDRVYHHTAPITMNYALYEALRIVVEEGLEARFRRHRANAAALQAGLGGMGFGSRGAGRLPAAATHHGRGAIGDRRGEGARRNCWRSSTSKLAPGWGRFKGKVWRIGLMGESCKRENVMLVLSALETILESMGFEIARGKSLAAADRAYNGSAA